MNMKKYMQLQSDLVIAKMDLEKRFRDLTKEEFGVQYEGCLTGTFAVIKPNGKNYRVASYDYAKNDSFYNEELTISEIERFIKVIRKLEEVS